MNAKCLATAVSRFCSWKIRLFCCISMKVQKKAIIVDFIETRNIMNGGAQPEHARLDSGLY